MKFDEFLQLFDRPRRSGRGFLVKCPAHDDKNPSLSISEKEEKILLHCFANCKTASIVEALGLKMYDLSIESSRNGQQSEKKIITVYPYHDEQGNELYQVVRYEPKDFRPRVNQTDGSFKYSLEGVRRVLYRLPEVLKADQVIIVEGEKDVETARSMGFTATTSQGGANGWLPEYGECLKGKKVSIISDNDNPGRKYAETVRQSLEGKASSVKIISLPAGKDLTDFLNLRRGEGRKPEEIRAEIEVIIEAAPKGENSARPKHLKTALLNFKSLLKLEIPERIKYLPWLVKGGLAMVYGGRGVGKTMFGLGLATSLVSGEQFLKWTPDHSVGVLYIDGEMSLSDMRERATRLMKKPPTAPLEFLSGENVYHTVQRDLVLTHEENQFQIDEILKDNPEIRVIVIDNISCLFSGISEDKKQDWEPIQSWLIRLRHRGLSVILIHHAGKGGQQRGTSGREDALDCIIQLSLPPQYSQDQGCQFELRFTKSRSVTGEEVKPLDVRLEEQDGQLVWRYSNLEESKERQAERLYLEGITSPSELAEELGITKGYASKLLRKVKKNKVS